MGSAHKVAVVTGASSGLGKAAAEAFARLGWRVIAIGRDPERSAAADADIRAASIGGGVDMLVADLSSLRETAQVAKKIASLTDEVHVLANNAGGMARDMALTPEGLERNFAGNYLGPFALTNALLPLMKRAAADAPKGSVRIINTSSDASEMIPGLNWDDIQMKLSWSSGGSYCSAKLANVLHARALAKRLSDDGIVAHAFHPGTVDSNFVTHASESTQAYIKTLEHISPEDGADTLMWLAIAEEPGHSSGGYYCRRAPRKPNPVTLDDAYVERLWVETERLVSEAQRS